MHVTIEYLHIKANTYNSMQRDINIDDVSNIHARHASHVSMLYNI